MVQYFEFMPCTSDAHDLYFENLSSTAKVNDE